MTPAYGSLMTDGRVRPVVSIVEGPDVNLVTSDHPEWMTIACETDRPALVEVEVKGRAVFSSSGTGLRHEVQVTGLLPGRAYSYRVRALDGKDTAAYAMVRFQDRSREREDGCHVRVCWRRAGRPTAALSSATWG